MKIYKNTIRYIDWYFVAIYLFLVFVGLLSVCSIEQTSTIYFGLPFRCFKQIVWLLISLLFFFAIININTQNYQNFAYIIYGIVLCLLLGTVFLGKTIGGHNSWYKIKFIYLQPSEFAKIAVALAISRYISSNYGYFTKKKDILIFCIIILAPMLLIILQGDMGSAIIFCCFAIVAYREKFPIKWIFYVITGLGAIVATLVFPKIYLIIIVIFLSFFHVGINVKKKSKLTPIAVKVVSIIFLILSTNLVILKILKPHQQNRIRAILNPSTDLKGINWNITQAKIAIASGGIYGKGFLKGLQTKYGFVPAQATDFIFSNIAEEHGFCGASIIIILFVILLLKILDISEKQKSRFGRTYGYSVFSVLLAHFIINIGMTLGLLPVIGIPLPFISYGGSSLFAFSIMIFILIKLDIEKSNYFFQKKHSKTILNLFV